MANVSDIAITSLEVITAFDVLTGDHLFTLDELQNATLSNSEEKQDIVGKQGRKLTSLKRNKAVTISGSNGLVSCGLFERQVGNSFEEKVTDVMWTDYLTVNSNKAKTTYVAVGEEGAEIVSAYVKNSDGTLGAAMEQANAAAAATGTNPEKFAYDPDTKEMTFASKADGTEVIVYYKRKITANVLENQSDNYSGKATLYIDAIGEDKCANVYRIQIRIPKADFSGEFSLEMGDSQTMHNFEAEALAGSCGGSGSLWDYIVFDSNAADHTEVDDET